MRINNGEKAAAFLKSFPSIVLTRMTSGSSLSSSLSPFAGGALGGARDDTHNATKKGGGGEKRGRKQKEETERTTMTLDSIASRTGTTFPAMDGATTKTGLGGVLEARTSRISFDDVEKNKGGDEYIRRKVFVAGEVMRLTTTLEEDGIESSADEEEEEEEDEDEEFCVVRKRDIVSCELVVGSKIKKKNKTETKTTRQHRIVITSFPRKKRLIDYAVLPRFLSSSASAFTSRNAGDDFSAAAAKGNSGKRFGHKKNVHVVKYKSLDEALEDVKRIEEECGLEHQRMNKRGRFLVFINPAAGRGKAEEVFKKHVEPVLKCARNCVVEAIVTTRSGETEERTYERSKESLLLTRGRGYESNTTTHNEDARVLGIIAIGGDGTIAEAYAGVERAQKELGTHESIPIGAIPAGSGNAICVSLAEQSEEVNDATTMALLIAKGQTIRLDGARLAIYRNDENGSNDTTNDTTKSTSSKRRLSLDRRNGSKKNGSNTNNNISNNRIAVYQNTALLSVSWGFFADVDLESERFRCLGGTRFIVQAIARLINLRTYKMDLTYRVSQETKSVCERLGKSLLGRKEGEFRTIKDENILGIWAMNLPWGSGDTKSAPLASPSDGFFDIIIVHPTSKLNLLKLLLDFDTKGSHAKNDAVTYLKTSEFELTLLGRSDLTEGVSGSTNASRSNAANPLGCVDGGEDPDAPSAPPDLYEGGRVMIDGEVVPDVCSREETFTVKGSVERGLANVFSFAPSSSSPQTYSSSSFHVVAAAAAGGSIA